MIAGYIPPGHGDSTSNATPLVPTIISDTTTASFSEVGIVSQTNALDVFSIQATSGGSLYVYALPVYGYLGDINLMSRSNLDLLVTFYDSSGSIIGTINPPGLAADGSVELPAAGTYYLSVTGTGDGDPFNTTGYSAYGSLGQYLLTGTFPIAPP
jgi:hypothetical protein